VAEQSKKPQEVHARAIKQFDAIQSSVRDERLQCLSDRRFYSIAGAQWEGPLADQFANKPRFEMNKVHLSVIRIINEYRNNRVMVTFIPKDGEERNVTADACNSLYRADRYDSNAEQACDNAFEEACSGGFGAYRLRTEYEDDEDDEDERQRIRWEPIYDADSTVFFDRDAKKQDKSDAKHAYVLVPMTPDAYSDEYEDDPATWPKDITLSEFDWYVPNDTVWTAEYFEVELTKETITFFRGLDDSEQKFTEKELTDELRDQLQATGYREARRKKVKRKRIHKYIMSGGKILEDAGYIVGKRIPIVPVYGKRWVVDNVERCMGHVRLAKDSQRLKNMQMSKLAEISAKSSVEKPILTPEQISGYGGMWAQDNVEDFPYLLVNPVTDAMGNPTAVGPQSYTRVPNIPPAMAAILQQTEQDMRDILGNSETLENVGNQVSGVAMEMAGTRLDMQTFIYMSNFAKSEQTAAEIWQGMAKECYVEENRKMKGMDEQGKPIKIELNRPVLNKESGEIEYENDLTEESFDVMAVVGPTSISRKQSAVRALSAVLQATTDPETAQVISSSIMLNMEAEGIGEIRDYFRQKLIRMGAVKPNEDEQKQMMEEQQAASQQPPDPNTMYLIAAAQKEQAGAEKLKADTMQSLAKTDEIKVGIAESVQDMKIAGETNYLDTLDRLQASQEKSSNAATVQPPSMGEYDTTGMQS
jgi:sulfur relay (sulfurtransferase) DsrC/TusE family protein